MRELIPEGTKAVFFDHDDTLVDTYDAKSKQHKYVAKKWYGIDLPDELIVQNWGKPLNELYRVFYQTDDLATVRMHVDEVYNDFPKKLFDGTIETLQALHDRGLYTGIITATAKYSIDKDLKMHNIPQSLIDYIQTQENTEYHKPDPRVFAPAVRWLGARGVASSQVLYVGDSPNDMLAAKGAGFCFVGVETGFTTRQQFEQMGAVSVKSLVELVQ